jgi:uncharacterized coiled-coil DUF342 family protein
MRRYDIETGLLPEAAEKLRKKILEYEDKVAILEEENRNLRDIITNLQEEIGLIKDRIKDRLPPS